MGYLARREELELELSQIQIKKDDIMVEMANIGRENDDKTLQLKLDLYHNLLNIDVDEIVQSEMDIMYHLSTDKQLQDHLEERKRDAN
jgi:predicted solute-binding protein